MAKSHLLLEYRECWRCCGSGRYGPTSVYAGICFKCNGKGEVLTKRGRAAQDYLNLLKQAPVSSFVVGDRYLSEGFSAGSYAEPNRWIQIDSVEALGNGHIRLRGFDKNRPDYRTSYEGAPDSKLRKARDAERVKADKEKALAFQALLGKNGKPLKAHAEKVAELLAAA